MSDLSQSDNARAGSHEAPPVVAAASSLVTGPAEQLAPLFFLRGLIEGLEPCWPLPTPTADFYDRSLLFDGIELASSEELLARYGDWDAVLAAAGLPPVSVFEAVQAEAEAVLQAESARLRAITTQKEAEGLEEADLSLHIRQLLGVDEQVFQKEVARLVARNAALLENPCREIECEPSPLRTPEQLEGWWGSKAEPSDEALLDQLGEKALRILESDPQARAKAVSLSEWLGCMDAHSS